MKCVDCGGERDRLVTHRRNPWQREFSHICTECWRIRLVFVTHAKDLPPGRFAECQKPGTTRRKRMLKALAEIGVTP